MSQEQEIYQALPVAKEYSNQLNEYSKKSNQTFCGKPTLYLREGTMISQKKDPSKFIRIVDEDAPINIIQEGIQIEATSSLGYESKRYFVFTKKENVCEKAKLPKSFSIVVGDNVMYIKNDEIPALKTVRYETFGSENYSFSGYVVVPVGTWIFDGIVSTEVTDKTFANSKVKIVLN